MKKSNLEKELTLLNRCTEYLEKFIGQCSDTTLEKITDRLGARIKGNLTFAKWKAVCGKQVSVR